MSILDKMNAIQAELVAPKGNRNDFGGYNYRSCEDILKALSPLMIKHKTVVNLSEELVDLGGRIYVKATARLLDCESSDTLSSTSFAKESESKKGMDSAQITGSTTSYARKYALAALFAIDNEKDPDAIDADPRTHAPEPEEKAPEMDEKARIIEEIRKLDSSYSQKILNIKKVSSFDQIPTDYLMACLKRCKEKNNG